MSEDAFLTDLRDALKSGADPNGRGEGGIALLHYWVSAGRADLADLLLQNGADINLADDSGWTALHFASANGNMELVRLLVERGANVNAQAESPDTRTFLDKLLGRAGRITPRRAASNAGHSSVADYLGEKNGRL